MVVADNINIKNVKQSKTKTVKEKQSREEKEIFKMLDILRIAVYCRETHYWYVSKCTWKLKWVFNICCNATCWQFNFIDMYLSYQYNINKEHCNFLLAVIKHNWKLQKFHEVKSAEMLGRLCWQAGKCVKQGNHCINTHI